MQANLPILSSNFPEMKNIINQYNIGFTFNIESIEDVANTINKLYKDESAQNTFTNNCVIASKKLIWEVEEQKLFNLYKNIKER